MYEQEGAAFVLDAFEEGNLTRYFNGACQDCANVVQQAVCSGPEHHYFFYRQCFFAARDIKPSEELTLYYGELYKWPEDARCPGCHMLLKNGPSQQGTGTQAAAETMEDGIDIQSFPPAKRGPGRPVLKRGARGKSSGPGRGRGRGRSRGTETGRGQSWWAGAAAPKAAAGLWTAPLYAAPGATANWAAFAAAAGGQVARMSSAPIQSAAEMRDSSYRNHILTRPQQAAAVTLGAPLYPPIASSLVPYQPTKQQEQPPPERSPEQRPRPQPAAAAGVLSQTPAYQSPGAHAAASLLGKLHHPAGNGAAPSGATEGSSMAAVAKLLVESFSGPLTWADVVPSEDSVSSASLEQLAADPLWPLRLRGMSDNMAAAAAPRRRSRSPPPRPASASPRPKGEVSAPPLWIHDSFSEPERSEDSFEIEIIVSEEEEEEEGTGMDGTANLKGPVDQEVKMASAFTSAGVAHGPSVQP